MGHIGIPLEILEMSIRDVLKDIRGGVGPAGRGGFKGLLVDVIRAKRKLGALNPLLAARISAAAFLRESLAIARSNEFRIETLRIKIDSDPDSVPKIRQFLMAAEKFVLEGNCSRPTADVRDYGFPVPTEKVAEELSGLGNFSLLEVFALAVKNAVDSYGQTLRAGKNTKVYDDQRRLAESEFRTLQNRIGREWTLDDVALSRNRENGRLRLTFKISSGDVDVHPLENAGERLVSWLEGHPDAL